MTNSFLTKEKAKENVLCCLPLFDHKVEGKKNRKENENGKNEKLIKFQGKARSCQWLIQYTLSLWVPHFRLICGSEGTRFSHFDL